MASCKRIAETTRQQNNFQNVRFVHFSLSIIPSPAASSSVRINFELSSLISTNTGERRVVPGGPCHRQGLLSCHSDSVFYRYYWDLPYGSFQPASFLTFPRRFQKLSPSSEMSWPELWLGQCFPMRKTLVYNESENVVAY